MFDNLLRNHTLSVVGNDGQLATRRATCAEAEANHGSHTRIVLAPNGEGGVSQKLEVVNCNTAEVDRQALLRLRDAQEAELGRLNSEVTRLTQDVANYRRLIAGAMQIVFHMGPALQKLLAENLADPQLTDDQSAVKIENVLFTVIIDPFGERIVVRDVAGNVRERSFVVLNGHLNEDNQTLLLGHVDRIKKAASEGSDPVTGAVQLVQAQSAA